MIAILVGSITIYGTLVSGSNATFLVTGIVFVLIGIAIIQYTRNDSHYNLAGTVQGTS